MKTQTIKQIIQVINSSNDFLITSHLLPDGDALGSVIALGLALKKLNKNVAYHIDPTIGEKFSFLPEINNLSTIIDGGVEVGISLDCSDTNHLYGADLLKQCKTILNIDHHVSNKGYGDFNIIDSEAAATGEIVYEIIKSLGISLDVDIAKVLYTAIVTDTGNFKYSNVTSETHYIVSQLLEYPIAAWKINKLLYDEHPKSKILLMGRAISNLELLLEERVALIVISQDNLKETGASSDDIEGIINIGRDISGIEVSVLLKETSNNEFKVGFRSNEYVDVGDIAFALGGGGHNRASGCTMAGEKEEIIDVLKRIISKKL